MITLRPIRKTETDAVKAVVDAVFQSLWGISYEEIRTRYDPLEDVENIQSHYFENGGVFMVLADGERVIGTDGISRLDAGTAELKRIFLLEEYHGRGLGHSLVESLLDFARISDYQQVRLMVASPDLKTAAIGLYTRLGFCSIPSGLHNSKELHMTLALS